MFRFGTDAILLAGFVSAGRRDSIVDLGTGSGVIALLLASRTGAKVTGVELQPKVAELACRNVALNNMESQVRILNADIREGGGLSPGEATVVVCNPPYDKAFDVPANISEGERLARYEEACTLVDAVSCSARALKNGGRCFMIHRASRTASLLHTLKMYSLEPKVMRFISSRSGRAPKYVLIKSIKCANEGLHIIPELVVYGENGDYTDEVRNIYHL